MSAPLTDAPICVTGATGYVAGHVVRELLERGATVRATARDPSNKAKVGHLERLAEQHPGNLELFAADLLEPGSFDAAVDGCEVVIHTASPFLIGKVGDPQRQLVDPAVKGTTTVIDSVERTDSVRRIVLTSSVAAVSGRNSDCAERGGVLDERHWNTSSTLADGAYSLSKKLAEEAAWDRCKAQDRWDLVTINPGFVMGPSLTSRNDSASIDFLLQLLDGRLRTGIWSLIMPWVDVRDVAHAHVEAAVRPDAEGRHLLVERTADVWEVIGGLEADFPGQYKLPMLKVPKLLAYLAAPPVGFSWSYVTHNVAVPLTIDNTRSRERLGVDYIPLRQTIRDHVEQLVRDGLIRP